MDEQKRAFINNDFFSFLKNINPGSTANWGKMSAQQMVEHVGSFFDLSTEKIIFPLSVPEEYLPKYREFLFSDKQFRENTKAPANVLGEEPLPLEFGSYDEALVKLRESVDHFQSFFLANPAKKTMHPAFGPLNFEEWVLLHYKHVTHHLRQFGVEV